MDLVRSSIDFLGSMSSFTMVHFAFQVFLTFADNTLYSVFYDLHAVLENRQQDLILELHEQKIYPEPSRPKI
jgi:hypothetical protein